MNLRQSHPQAEPVEILDLVLRGRSGSLADLGNLHPTSPFGQLLAAVFDSAMDPREWTPIDSPNAESAVLFARSSRRDPRP